MMCWLVSLLAGLYSSVEEDWTIQGALSAPFLAQYLISVYLYYSYPNINMFGIILSISLLFMLFS